MAYYCGITKNNTITNALRFTNKKDLIYFINTYNNSEPIGHTKAVKITQYAYKKYKSNH